MAKVRIFENNTKVTQIFYDKFMNPIVLKPGQRHEEDMSEVINHEEMRKKEIERFKLEGEVEESKRVKSTLAVIRVSKNIEDLERLRKKETNTELITAILKKQKELLDKEIFNYPERAKSDS